MSRLDRSLFALWAFLVIVGAFRIDRDISHGIHRIYDAAERLISIALTAIALYATYAVYRETGRRDLRQRVRPIVDEVLAEHRADYNPLVHGEVGASWRTGPPAQELIDQAMAFKCPDCNVNVWLEETATDGEFRRVIAHDETCPWLKGHEGTV